MYDEHISIPYQRRDILDWCRILLYSSWNANGLLICSNWVPSRSSFVNRSCWCEIQPQYFIYIYIHMYRETERERGTCQIYMYIYVCTYIRIYIYVESKELVVGESASDGKCKCNAIYPDWVGVDCGQKYSDIYIHIYIYTYIYIYIYLSASPKRCFYAARAVTGQGCPDS